jgi:pimeloyl-ACP methyl ester carboxylesterase
MNRSRILVATLAATFVVVAIALVSAWTPDRSVAELSQRWAPPPSTFLSVDGLTAHLRDEGVRGDPEPIILLHGTSSSLHTWDGWAAGLADHRRVIRADLPGFGLTGPTPNGRYDIATYTHFVIALMDQLGVQRAVLAGNSLGGYVAWKTAVDHPDRVSRLILVDSAGYSFRSTSVPIAFRLARNPLLAPLMTHLLSRRMVESSVRNVYGDPSKVTPELVARYYEITLRTGNRRAMIDRFRQIQDGEFADQVRRVTQPTLILWGGQDRLIPPENAERFHADIAGSRLVVFDRLGHVPQEEDPVATLAAVRSFLGD